MCFHGNEAIRYKRLIGKVYYVDVDLHHDLFFKHGLPYLKTIHVFNGAPYTLKVSHILADHAAEYLKSHFKKEDQNRFVKMIL